MHGGDRGEASLSKRRTKQTRLQKSIDELKARQQNVTWPGFVSNARSVDETLLKGSPDGPLVQRVGRWIVGITLFGAGLVIALDSFSGSALELIPALAALAFGGLVLWRGSPIRRGHK